MHNPSRYRSSQTQKSGNFREFPRKTTKNSVSWEWTMVCIESQLQIREGVFRKIFDFFKFFEFSEFLRPRSLFDPFRWNYLRFLVCRHASVQCVHNGHLAPWLEVRRRSQRLFLIVWPNLAHYAWFSSRGMFLLMSVGAALRTEAIFIQIFIVVWAQSKGCFALLSCVGERSLHSPLIIGSRS